MQSFSYSFRKGSRINLNAEKVYNELIEIKNNNEDNIASPAEVVEFAKTHKDSELNKGFEWDIEKAAYQYNLQQARHIINNIIRIEVKLPETVDDSEDIKEHKIEFRPFTHLDGDIGYKSTIEIYSSEDNYERLVKQAFDDLKYWREKYNDIVEFKQIFEDIDNFNLNN